MFPKLVIHLTAIYKSLPGQLGWAEGCSHQLKAFCWAAKWGQMVFRVRKPRGPYSSISFSHVWAWWDFHSDVCHPSSGLDSVGCFMGRLFHAHPFLAQSKGHISVPACRSLCAVPMWYNPKVIQPSGCDSRSHFMSSSHRNGIQMSLPHSLLGWEWEHKEPTKSRSNLKPHKSYPIFTSDFSAFCYECIKSAALLQLILYKENYCLVTSVGVHRPLPKRAYQQMRAGNYTRLTEADTKGNSTKRHLGTLGMLRCWVEVWLQLRSSAMPPCSSHASAWGRARSILLIWMKTGLMFPHNNLSSFERVNCEIWAIWITRLCVLQLGK